MQKASDEFKAQVRAAFEEIELQQQFSFRRSFSDGDVALFCGVTGDFNPLHMDDLYMQESWYGRRIVPGLLTASMSTHIGGLLGFVATEFHFELLHPVYIGDTILCTVTIVEKNAEQRRLRGDVACQNQDGETVLRGAFAGFPTQVRLKR